MRRVCSVRRRFDAARAIERVHVCKSSTLIVISALAHRRKISETGQDVSEMNRIRGVHAVVGLLEPFAVHLT